MDDEMEVEKVDEISIHQQSPIHHLIPIPWGWLVDWSYDGRRDVMRLLSSLTAEKKWREIREMRWW